MPTTPASSRSKSGSPPSFPPTPLAPALSTPRRPPHPLPEPVGSPAQADEPLGVYLHVPFCAHICPYCDFNTYAGKGDLIPRYVGALEREIARHGAELDGRTAATVYFGGGTPSLLSPAQVGQLLQACRAAFALAPNAEITLEANPNGVETDYFAGLLQVGVNRLSLGVQTLSPRGLRALGRLHGPADAARAAAAARTAGFANISFDCIFGWPDQTLAVWREDLDRILAGEVGGSPPEHLSLYSLIVEPGTPMADAVKRGIVAVPDDDAAADLYETAMGVLANAGWTHYEVANWARDPALVSRHNRVYWRNGDFVGAGAGAHGTVAGRRWMNHPLPETYIAAVGRGEQPVATIERISPRVAMGETMMLGLRLLEAGISPSRFTERHGATLETTFGSTVAELAEIGLVTREPDRVRLTRRGLLLANDVCARFV
ncbi:MAG: radical SAM family heme chaperone HemW [Thermomicrobiales bacterium]|nr:radical SAM family heme chaperone HemW [Thermomicrobiales bacterium]